MRGVFSNAVSARTRFFARTNRPTQRGASRIVRHHAVPQRFAPLFIFLISLLFRQFPRRGLNFLQSRLQLLYPTYPEAHQIILHFQHSGFPLAATGATAPAGCIRFLFRAGRTSYTFCVCRRNCPTGFGIRLIRPATPFQHRFPVRARARVSLTGGLINGLITLRGILSQLLIRRNYGY